MKAVYVTYWLNRLQNLETQEDIFVSLNPHERPEASKIHKRVVMAHPQLSPSTLAARDVLEQENQGKEGLWFCGEDMDPMKMGVVQVSKWPSSSQVYHCRGQSMRILAAPNLSSVKPHMGLLMRMVNSLYHSMTYELPVAVCLGCNSSITFSRVLCKRKDSSSNSMME